MPKVIITYNSQNVEEKRSAMMSANKLHKANIYFRFNRRISARCFVIVNNGDFEKAREIIGLK